MTTPPLSTRIRPLEEIDLPEVVRIETASFPQEEAWSRRKFEAHWRRPTTRILVAANCYNRVLAYCVFDRLSGASYSIVNLAVDPWCRRRGVGWELIKHIRDYAHPAALSVSVNETWLPAQCFLRASGFKAVLPIERDAFGSWLHFQWLAPTAVIKPVDMGLLVLRSILQGDGRTIG
jgi:ribosomal protein S18 acetylase RimI-like enzyme